MIFLAAVSLTPSKKGCAHHSRRASQNRETRSRILEADLSRRVEPENARGGRPAHHVFQHFAHVLEHVAERQRTVGHDVGNDLAGRRVQRHVTVRSTEDVKRQPGLLPVRARGGQGVEDL